MSAVAEIRRPALRYFGGKWRMSPWIISHFPPHRVYVEPYGGAASVLLRKPRVKAEVYNDMDGEIVNLFQVLRDRGDELVQAIELTPYARDEFYLSFIHTDDQLERARRVVLRSFAGYGGNLTRPNRDGSPQRTGFRTFCGTGRGRSTCGDWRALPPELRKIVERMQGVCIEHREATRVITEQDSAGTLHYIDPPYVHDSRSATCGGSIRGYRFEMTDQQHRQLAEQLRAVKGMVVLSGYPSTLYDELYGDWERLDRKAHADGARPRIECVWLNPACADAQRQKGLFT